MIDNSKFDLSLNDTSELRQMILDNPDLPLMVFCGEECNNGDYCYMSAKVTSCKIQEMTVPEDELTYMSKDDYEEWLNDRHCDDKKYKDLTDEEYDEAIKKEVEDTPFFRAIVVYVNG